MKTIPSDGQTADRAVAEGAEKVLVKPAGVAFDALD
jgi:hypothetical protein